MALAEKNFIRPPSAMPLIQKRTEELNFTMSSDELTGALLATLAASKPHGNFLEIGTGTGSGTAWLLQGMSANSRLISVDNDPQVILAANEALGHDARLTLVCEDALSFIKKQTPENFDLIFADSYPGKYVLLEETLSLVRKGGFYIIDDMLPQSHWPEEHFPRVEKLLKDLANLQGFQALPLQWSSGLIVFSRVL